MDKAMRQNGWWRVAESRPVGTISLVGLMFAATYLVAVLRFPAGAGRIINGDAIQYFAYLQSAVVDGDLDFSNDYLQLYANADPATNVWLRSRTPTGRVPNLMSVGPAILWAPFYVGTRVALGVVDPGKRSDALLYASVGVAGVVYATLGALFTFWSCARLFRPRAAFWATLVVWLAGPAVYYSLVSPTYSHATSMFAVAVFAFAWLATRNRVGFGFAALLGALGGLVALVRWQDALVLLLPAADLIAAGWRSQADWAPKAPTPAGVPSAPERRVGLAITAARLAVLGLAAGVVFLPQLLAWNAVYGTPLLIPQGSAFMQWTQPAMLSVLFSLKRGLFSWTPALLPAAVGLPLLVRRDRLAGWMIVVVLLVTLYVNASVHDWWAGEAFGARRFIGFGVFLALALAALMDLPAAANRPALVAWLSVVAIAYNLLFVFQYQMFMRGQRHLVPYPDTAVQVFLERLWLPFQLLLRWGS